MIEEESNDEPAVFRFVFNVTDPQATQASIKLSGKPVTALRMKAVNRFGTITSLPTSVGICRPIPPLEGTIVLSYTSLRGLWKTEFFSISGATYG